MVGQKELKNELENIAGGLVDYELGYSGSMFIPVIQEGICRMTGGRIDARPMSVEKVFYQPELVTGCNLHNIYGLFLGAERVGQLYIDSWPHVGSDSLKKGLEVALRSYPTDRCTIIGAGLTAFKGVARDHTQYGNIFLGPALPADCVVKDRLMPLSRGG
jgi:hypothetical protein